MVPPVFVLLRLCTTVVQDGSPKKVVCGLARMKRKKPPSGDEGSRYSEKQEPSILIDLESLSRLSTEQLEKDIITMESLILAQDER